MNLLAPPDERTKAALTRLRHDQDYQEVLAWLEFSLQRIDAAKREQIDGIVLRMQQGSAKTLAELIANSNGDYTKGAIAPRNTQFGLQGSANTVAGKAP